MAKKNKYALDSPKGYIVPSYSDLKRKLWPMALTLSNRTMCPGSVELHKNPEEEEPRRAVPLLITLDLHKHRELEYCVAKSAEFFTQHNQRATYFVPAAYVRMYEPLAGTLRQARAMGHSVGCHGLNHTPDEDLGGLPPDREFELLKEATVILEDALGGPVTSFRAPS